MLILAGCSQPAETTAAKKAPEKPKPATGQSALWKMYQAARTWASDLEVLSVNSIPLSGVDEVRGAAPAWQATFVSASKSRSRSWTFSVVEGEGNLHKGVFAGLEEAWSGPRGLNSPFPIGAVKIDTAAAYETAKAKAVDYEKRNPGKMISFVLERIKKYPDPAWRVIWGESISTSDFSVYVDASTGGYLETLH